VGERNVEKCEFFDEFVQVHSFYIRIAKFAISHEVKHCRKVFGISINKKPLILIREEERDRV
jgi:hypothetical protein